MWQAPSDHSSMALESQHSYETPRSSDEVSSRDQQRNEPAVGFSQESLQSWPRRPHQNALSDDNRIRNRIRNPNFAQGSVALQQPTPNHTRMDLELDQMAEASSLNFSAGDSAIGFSQHGGFAKVCHDGNHAHITNDSACFTSSPLQQNPVLDFDSFIEPLPDEFQLDTEFGFQDNVSLTDFPPSYGMGHVAP
jgi:hypothetical protein